MPDPAALNGQNIGETQKKEDEAIVPIARHQISASENKASGNEQVGFVRRVAGQVEGFDPTWSDAQ